MKYLILVLVLISLDTMASSLVTDPTTSADNTVSSSASDVVGLTLNTTYDGIDSNSVDGIGVYGSSQTFYGIYGTSYSESSGYFTSGTSVNTKPTVVIQSVGGNADLMQVQNVTGTVLFRIDKDGHVYTPGGLN